MLDFVRVCSDSKKTKDGTIWTIKPGFYTTASKDVMVRGGDFYAVWDEDTNLWSTDEDIVSQKVDKMLEEHVKTLPIMDGDKVIIQRMKYAESGSIDRWHKLVQKQKREDRDRKSVV